MILFLDRPWICVREGKDYTQQRGGTECWRAELHKLPGQQRPADDPQNWRGQFFLLGRRTVRVFANQRDDCSKALAVAVETALKELGMWPGNKQLGEN